MATCQGEDSKKDIEEDYRILMKQMEKERIEYKADTERLNHVLSSANFVPHLSNIAELYIKSLQTAADALDVSTPDTINLTLALSDFGHELETAEEMLESSQERNEKYKQMLPKILQQKELWRKKCSELESQEEQCQQNSSKTIKSTLFHSKKKRQYEMEIESNKQALTSVGYEESLSHETLTELGNEVQQMEERLKPLRLQLNSYKDLPLSLTQAQVKLEAKRMEFKRVEKDFTEKLGEISSSSSII